MSVSPKMSKECEQLRQECSYYLEEIAKSRQLLEMVHDDDEDKNSGYSLSFLNVEKLLPRYSDWSRGGRRITLASGRGQLEVPLESGKQALAIDWRRLPTGLTRSAIVEDGYDNVEIQDMIISKQPGPIEKYQSMSEKRELSYKLNKLFLEFHALFCHLDLFATNDSDKTSPATDFFKLFGLIRVRSFPSSKSDVDKSIWSKSKYSYIWPKIILLLYFSSSCHVIYSMFYQYCHDYYLFRLKRVRWLNQTQPSEIVDKLDLEQEDYLLANIGREYLQLERIGAPHVHLSFAAQCIYLAILILPLLSYLALALYFKFKSPFNFYFIRNFLNYSAEDKRHLRFVRHQVVSFIKSSSNHVRALEEFSLRSIGKRELTARERILKLTPAGTLAVVQPPPTSKTTLIKSQGQFQNRNRMSEVGGGGSNRVASMAARSQRQLIEMFENNDLRPINQSLKWIERQAVRYTLLCTIGTLYAVITFSAYSMALVQLRDVDKQLKWQDLILLAELIFLAAILPLTATFYATLLIFTCVDLSLSANRLRKLMRHVIDLNTMRFYRNLHLKARHDIIRQTRRMSLISLREYPAKSSHQKNILSVQQRHQNLVLHKLIDTHAQLIKFDSSYEANMNRDLLLALMQYRIFSCQLKVHTQATSYIALTAVLIMFIFPVVYRLHLPYIDKTSDTNLNLVVLALCSILVLAVNVTLLPACYLHRRCLEVYNQLNSLLAHATDVVSYQEGRDIYDGHILSVLRKEMMYPDRMAAKFALKCCGVTFTYSSLVRFQFYLGFIILSIFSEYRNSNQETTGTIFSDPFGLF